MANESILKQRISARDSSEREIGIDVLKEIIEEAALAPSWAPSLGKPIWQRGNAEETQGVPQENRRIRGKELDGSCAAA